MTELLLIAIFVALTTWVVASVLPPTFAGPWLLGAWTICTIVAPQPYAAGIAWTGMVVGLPVWASVKERKRKIRKGVA